MKILKWILRILFAGLFACMAAGAVFALYSLSAEPGTVSAQRSGWLTSVIEQEVQEHIQSSPRAFEAAQKARQFVETHSPYGSDWQMNIRKLAHFSVYFLISSLFYLIFSALHIPHFGRWILCISLGMALACFDEMYQSQIPGRVMSYTDVMIDGLGVVSASTLLTLTGSFFGWLSRI